ncbi:Superkiller protein 3 [Steccherinum ochraceum]|uniref:Superkiller protein 3 n=1 Tax=Steccherinum ochraceum TaxID=92696 RepID=A0A4R0R0K2_9APHY|nr:Superkiller protein 3 [Steccherinum ochraceum]
MSAFVKTKLKNAREAIGKKNYEVARDAARGVLEYEPENYHAYVFIGLACLELGEIENSEQAYRKAIELNSEQVLAWQGITKLYERTEKWGPYGDALQHVTKLFLKAHDAVKCAEALQRFVEIRRSHGTSSQLCDALHLWLPTSEYYPLLSTLPPPDATNPNATTTFTAQSAMQNSLPVLEEIVAVLETDEQATLKSEFDKRRTRLGAAGPEQIRKDVGREVWSSSKLPSLYNEIMNHQYAPDELRRSTESKLLRYKQQLLYALPITNEFAVQKADLAAELQDLVNGMILLDIPDELAWLIYIEGTDAPTIEEYDLAVFRKYIKLFPNAPLRDMFYAYLGYSDLPISEDEESVDGREPPAADEDYAESILAVFQKLPNSIVAHRIAAVVYEHDSDFENALKVAESGLELSQRHERNTSTKLHSVKKAFNVTLATSLVHLFPPKHHPRALRVLDEILTEDPDNVPGLMGRAYTLQYANKWSEAKLLFDRVAELLPDDLYDGIRAQEESAWCSAQSHDPDSAAKSLKSILNGLESLESRETDQARCWWRLGQCYWKVGESSREEAYRHFITALKRSATFAPAFTSLGIYYVEFASPPDPKRANKCFQRAFELDPREGDAARRLAEGFAEEREWDLVEVVAQRTIDGEGGMNAGLESAAATARYLPINAWAWKALGVVEMHYPAAIQAFQIALRTDTEDQLSWLRLGEAYSKAGRFEAAIKALRRAQELNPKDWIASYFLGDVERQTGQFQTAIDIFTAVLSKHSQETKVMLSLAQTHFDLGRSEFVSFFTARAESSFLASIKTVLRLMDTSSGYRRLAWKVAADALYHLSQLSTFHDTTDVMTTMDQLSPMLSKQTGDRLKDLIPLPDQIDQTSDFVLSSSLLDFAILAYDCKVSLGALDDRSSGSGSYDLGVALSAYARRVTEENKRDLAQQHSATYLKEALGFDPINDTYWSTLGTALFASQPKIAQHAYIKALEIDSRNAATWTDLGLFYLFHGDLQLATEAFYKAQILDPDYALAWVGRGLVAASEGHDAESKAFFEHSTGLPIPIPDADVAFATRLFAHLRSIRGHTSLDAIHPAFFVLDRYCKQRSQDAYAWHLFGLICESVGHVELGIAAIERAIAILEAAYEESENPIIERRFTIAHVNAGRLRLSAEDFEGALSSLQVALGLLPEDTTDQDTLSFLSQAQLCSGLAHFKLDQLEEALQFSESAMESSANDVVLRSHAVVVLAQTLWAIGTDEGKESAKSQLLQSIETDPENLLAINALAGMGILTDDDSLVDAALAEILSLSIPERQERDPEGDVTYLLIQHHLSQGDIAQAISVAQKAIVAHPSHPKHKQQLAALALQSGKADVAQAVLSSLSAEEDLTQSREVAALQALVELQGPQGRQQVAMRLARRAVMLAPWKEFDWRALACVRTQNPAGHTE